MAMQWIDWSIVIGLLVILIAMAVYAKRYTKGVADFLAANRCAGRYLLSISQGMAGMGAISIVGTFEMYYKAGLPGEWWWMLQNVAFTIVGLSGWVIYRYRQTRAMTMAQFIEIRYSKNLRKFMGLMAWLAGIINFGLFPAVGARFFLYFCNFPPSVPILGFEVSTYALIMITLLSISLYFTFVGGQVTIITTSFIEGIFCSIAFIVIFIAVCHVFNSSQIIEALSTAPKDESLLHPFQSKNTEDFNVTFYLIYSFTIFYGLFAWQGSQGYLACAINAHEARIGQILKTWRNVGMYFFILITAICAFTFMHHSDFAGQAQKVNDIVAGIENDTLQRQLTTPIAARFFLPTGIMGVFAALMLTAFISTHDTYLHSWGSIFIQDVIMPFRKKPFTPKQHLFLLRASVLFVAVFIFFFSLLFRQTEYIHMYFKITGAIFVGGAGSVIIGGLYWKRGTIAAGWAAMITGSVLSVAAIIMRQINASDPDFFLNILIVGKPLDYIAAQNGMVLSFYASISAIIVYISVSLSGSFIFNMDKMLHRGKYAIDEPDKIKAQLPARGIKALIGMGNEFNLRDKIIYLTTVGWTLLIVLVFIAGTIYNLVVDVKTQAWITFWKCYIWVLFAAVVITTVWFTFGGIIDLKKMFNLLAKMKRNDLDDGMVIDHHNIDEQPTAEPEQD
ncbi:MAG: sodium:solute symporter family protein [Planctomycetota bacterium]|jgi:SSS family solute:Na+ symporter